MGEKKEKRIEMDIRGGVGKEERKRRKGQLGIPNRGRRGVWREGGGGGGGGGRGRARRRGRGRQEKKSFHSYLTVAACSYCSLMYRKLIM